MKNPRQETMEEFAAQQRRAEVRAEWIATAIAGLIGGLIVLSFVALI